MIADRPRTGPAGPTPRTPGDPPGDDGEDDRLEEALKPSRISWISPADIFGSEPDTSAEKNLDQPADSPACGLSTPAATSANRTMPSSTR
ncbi:hypothetical protein FHX80_1143 [Streptomyces brevispora]|uniref:Uncharacterized protein n=1 Tax=Streptomyces brevispora TaxID=887462 RepID=A0A561UQJ9_9ACTN|nr:hypothetical protein FHX80_1143 [Streptomyces brevispora]